MKALWPTEKTHEKGSRALDERQARARRQLEIMQELRGIGLTSLP
ncbi:hypothetical protein QYZ40_26795 [Vibrio parahaemolyticus]|nr:hypothetical protein [Vibrio parahaemolyticus]